MNEIWGKRLIRLRFKILSDKPENKIELVFNETKTGTK